MPSGRPLTNRQATFQGAGIRAKATRASQDTPISPRIAIPRRAGAISEITLTPISLEMA